MSQLDLRNHSYRETDTTNCHIILEDQEYSRSLFHVKLTSDIKTISVTKCYSPKWNSL